jgi:hypothetical protein
VQVFDDFLVQFVGDGDEGVLEARGVQSAAHFSRKVVDVARIQADAEAQAPGAQGGAGLDRVGKAGFQGVVGVQEEDGGRGVQLTPFCNIGSPLQGERE